MTNTINVMMMMMMHLIITIVIIIIINIIIIIIIIGRPAPREGREEPQAGRPLPPRDLRRTLICV